MTDITPPSPVTPGWAILIAMYRAMEADPADVQKQLVYFKALADARLDDYYVQSDENTTLRQRVLELEAALRRIEQLLTIPASGKGGVNLDKARQLAGDALQKTGAEQG